VFKFVDHLSRVNRAVFHPDGSCVASASDDHAVKIWDLRRKRLIQHYDAHQGPVLDVAFAPQAYSPSQREDSPAGLSGGKNYLASCSADRSCKLWDLQEGRLLFTMEGHEDAVKSVRFSPHGKFLVSGGGDNKVDFYLRALFSFETFWKLRFSLQENAASVGKCRKCVESPRSSVPQVFCWRSGLAGGAEEELYEQPPAKLVAQGALHGARSYLYNAGGGGGGRSAGDAAVGGRERGDKASSPRGDASALRASASGGVAKKASASAVGNSTSAVEPKQQMNQSTLSAAPLNMSGISSIAPREGPVVSHSNATNTDASATGGRSAAKGGASAANVKKRSANPSRHASTSPGRAGGAGGASGGAFRPEARGGNTSGTDINTSDCGNVSASGKVGLKAPVSQVGAQGTARAADQRALTQMAETIAQMSAQMELLTQTVQLLEQRMSTTEQTVSKLFASAGNSAVGA